MSTNKITISASPGLLGIIFVVLKLVGAISWPWVWVLSPFWLPAAIVFTIAILVVSLPLIGLLLVLPFLILAYGVMRLFESLGKVQF